MSAGFRPATLDDGRWLAPRLREADRQETLAALGREPQDVLPAGIEAAAAAFTMVDRHGDRVGVFGVSPFTHNAGLVWLVATPALEAETVTFLRNSRQAVNELHKLFPALVNWTDARNTLHHRWIRWSGFTIFARSERFGAAGLPFLQFAKAQHPECAFP